MTPWIYSLLLEIEVLVLLIGHQPGWEAENGQGRAGEGEGGEHGRGLELRHGAK